MNSDTAKTQETALDGPKHFDFIIIGSGPAGQKAGVQASKCGKTVALIEREHVVGGACVHRGTIPSKTLRENALQLSKLKKHMASLSLNLTEDIQVTELMGNLERVLSSHDEYISNQIVRNDIVRLHGRAKFLDKNTIEITHLRGKKSIITGEHIIIATGSRPRDPDDIPVDHEHILDSDSILSMIYLPRSLVVLGAGVIACEYATIFAALGVKVTIIDRYPRPLGFLDPDLTDGFCTAFEQAGGQFIGNTNIKSVAWDGISDVVTTLESGEEIRTDKLLFALGRVANVDGLDLEKAGITLSDRGIIPVDEHCQTVVPHIYAVGDVVGPPALASSSMEQGRRASRHALKLDPGAGSEMIPMGIYTIPEMSTIGLTEEQVIKLEGGAVVGKAKFSEVARGHISKNESGILKMVAGKNGQVLKGVQIIGEGATELIHIAQMALLSKQEVDVFIDNIFNFPTLAEAYRVAALQIVEDRPPT
jgi:NAD(P) transhydrogenase